MAIGGIADCTSCSSAARSTKLAGADGGTAPEFTGAAASNITVDMIGILNRRP
jgi:hypothetical protein